MTEWRRNIETDVNLIGSYFFFALIFRCRWPLLLLLLEVSLLYLILFIRACVCMATMIDKNVSNLFRRNEVIIYILLSRRFDMLISTAEGKRLIR